MVLPQLVDVGEPVEPLLAQHLSRFLAQRLDEGKRGHERVRRPAGFDASAQHDVGECRDGGEPAVGNQHYLRTALVGNAGPVDARLAVAAEVEDDPHVCR